jgi:hypothetical protein
MYTSSMYHLYVCFAPSWSSFLGWPFKAQRRDLLGQAEEHQSKLTARRQQRGGLAGDHGRPWEDHGLVVNGGEWWLNGLKKMMENQEKTMDVNGFCWWDVIGCWWDEIGDLMLILMGYDGIFGRFVPFDIHIMRNDGMKWRCTVLNYG